MSVRNGTVFHTKGVLTFFIFKEKKQKVKIEIITALILLAIIQLKRGEKTKLEGIALFSAEDVDVKAENTTI